MVTHRPHFPPMTQPTRCATLSADCATAMAADVPGRGRAGYRRCTVHDTIHRANRLLPDLVVSNRKFRSHPGCGTSASARKVVELAIPYSCQESRHLCAGVNEGRPRRMT